jgi:hypothetical protein
MLVFKSCPHCGTQTSVGHPSVGIGKPFQKCIKCNNYIIDKDVNEWQLCNPLEKIKLWFALLWTMITISILVFIAVAMTANAWLKLDYGFDKLIPIAVFIIFIFSIKSIYGTFREISESNKRLTNPVYIAELESLGLYQRKNKNDKDKEIFDKNAIH